MCCSESIMLTHCTIFVRAQENGVSIFFIIIPATYAKSVLLSHCVNYASARLHMQSKIFNTVLKKPVAGVLFFLQF